MLFGKKLFVMLPSKGLIILKIVIIGKAKHATIKFRNMMKRLNRSTIVRCAVMLIWFTQGIYN